MAVEVVVLAPVLFAFVLLIVAMGRYVDVQGEVESTARDAVRAASLERDAPSAIDAARDVVRDSVPAGATCEPVRLTGAFVAGGTITAVLECSVSWDGLGFIGLPGSTTVTGESSAPLDTYRRTG